MKSLTKKEIANLSLLKMEKFVDETIKALSGQPIIDLSQDGMRLTNSKVNERYTLTFKGEPVAKYNNRRDAVAMYYEFIASI